MSEKDKRSVRTSNRLRRLEPGALGKQSYEVEMDEKVDQARQAPDPATPTMEAQIQVSANVPKTSQTVPLVPRNDQRASETESEGQDIEVKSDPGPASPVQDLTPDLSQNQATMDQADTPVNDQPDRGELTHAHQPAIINRPGAAQRYRTERFVVSSELVAWLKAFGFLVDEVDPVIQAGRLETIAEFVQFGNSNKNHVVRQIRPTVARIYSDQVAQIMLHVDYLWDELHLGNFLDDPEMLWRLSVHVLPGYHRFERFLKYVSQLSGPVQQTIEEEADAQRALVTERYSNGFSTELVDLTAASSTQSGSQEASSPAQIGPTVPADQCPTPASTILHMSTDSSATEDVIATSDPIPMEPSGTKAQAKDAVDKSMTRQGHDEQTKTVPS